MLVGVLGELAQVRAVLQMSALVVWFVLIGLVGCTAWTLMGTRLAGRRVPAPRLAAVLAVGFALVWILVDKQVEGWTLVILSDEHGVTSSDLASVVAGSIACWRLITLRISPPRVPSREPARSGGRHRSHVGAGGRTWW